MSNEQQKNKSLGWATALSCVAALFSAVSAVIMATTSLQQTQSMAESLTYARDTAKAATEALKYTRAATRPKLVPTAATLKKKGEMAELALQSITNSGNGDACNAKATLTIKTGENTALTLEKRISSLPTKRSCESFTIQFPRRIAVNGEITDVLEFVKKGGIKFEMAYSDLATEEEYSESWTFSNFDLSEFDSNAP